MSDLSVQLRITSVRSRGKHGGVIFAGTTTQGESYVAECDYHLVPDSTLVDKGQTWLVAGSAFVRVIEGSGFRRKETQIRAVSAQLLQPSGRNIISWIADSPDCAGIGLAKATKLYNRFGTGLIQHIEKKNIAALVEMISEECAYLLCHAFDKHKVANALLFLDQVEIPRRIGASVVAYFKHQTQEKIKENPYILISFEANWHTVDGFARNRFGVPEDSPLRLQAGIEEVLYRGLKSGHTCLPAQDVRSRLLTLLGSKELVEKALGVGDSQQFRCVGEKFQPTGMYLIESYLAKRFHDLAEGANSEGQLGLFSQFRSDSGSVDKILRSYESAQGIELTHEQRDAVLTCCGANLSLILGGAGTGKTTVLKSLYAVLAVLQPDLCIYQLALAGRAAQRMTEATNRDALTIAAFLAQRELAEIEVGTVIVIDEVSMVDVILMYRLLRNLPLGVRLILVGDPSQLPPIGPGLVLHALAGISSIPQVELKVVKRQSALSGIPHVAAAIRNHQIPSWAEYCGAGIGVSLIPCALNKIEETVQRVYEELGADGSDYRVQILSVTHANVGGVKNLNTLLHNRYRQEAERVNCFDVEFGVVGASLTRKVQQLDGRAFK